MPKTGGTAIHESLASYASFGFHSKNRDQTFKIPPQHFDKRKLTYFFTKDFFDFSFIVVRHPIDRLISEFFYRHPNGTPKNNWYKIFYSTRLPRKQDKISRMFSVWAARKMENFINNSDILDNHLRPQVDFVWNKKTMIFKFEQGFSKISQKLKDNTGTYFSFGVTNKSQKKPIKIDSETENLIYKFYEADFNNFYPKF